MPFCSQSFGFGCMPTNQTNRALWRIQVTFMHTPSSTFSGGTFSRLQGVRPSDSSILTSWMFRIIFVGLVWLCTRVYPCFLIFILTHEESFFWTICLGVGCVDVGRLLLPLLVLCQVQCPPAPCSADVALTRPALPWSMHHLSVLSPENL